jgi:hypothetical protein
MTYLKTAILLLLYLFSAATPVLAQDTNPAITEYTRNTLAILTPLAIAAAVFFLIRGGYGYILSAGNPQRLETAKATIKNALLGLILVLGAVVLINVFQTALTAPASSAAADTITLIPIVPQTPSSGLTQVLIDAVNGFMQNLVESATQPIMDGLFSFLTTTPSLMSNSVVFKFWLVSLGIVNSLFVIAVALLGLKLMSATTFGFEPVSLSQMLPKIGIAFLGANVSLFLADYVVTTANVLTKAVLESTGGLNRAWISNAINLEAIANNQAPLIILVFLIILLIVAIVLLLIYISRLIIISLAAVLSPFIFLLYLLPKFSDLAEIAVKSYFVSVFMLFIHVVIIQLAAAFLTLPEHTNNSLISIAVAIGLFITLLKTPSVMFQLVMYTSNSQTVKRLGGQIMNVVSTGSKPNQTRREVMRLSELKSARKALSR